MKYYVGVTDTTWFRYLSVRKPDEVNFWRPAARTPFKAIPAGAPFLFKLHKPDHYIVGGGFFAGYSRLPLSLAWDAFAEKNGAPDFPTFRTRIERYRVSRGLPTIDPEIGCVILTQPFFFEERDWIEAPERWGNSIVQGKTFETSDAAGLALWNAVEARLRRASASAGSEVVGEAGRAYQHVFGNQYLRTARLGQGAFRAMITEAYQKTCCITGEKTLPVLQAAHIRPVTQEGNHQLRNGLLLRADMHILFDRGLVGITPDYRIRISGRIREEYLNGKVYYAHDGQPLRSKPEDQSLCPDPNLLDWHMSHVFAG